MNKELQEIRNWLKELDRKLDNHLAHSVADISAIKNDLGWIKRFFWLVAGTSITAIFGSLFSIILR